MFGLALRQTEGLIGSIIGLLGLALRVPDHSTLSRRATTLQVPRPQLRRDGEPLHLLVDSTGLRLCGAGEWLLEKHGTRTRRSWRKLHIGVDAGSGLIVAASLTAKEVDDGAEVGPLLDQITGAVASFTADGGYDQDRVYAGVAERHPEAAVIVPPRATAVPSDTAETAPTQRDRHLQHIAKYGRTAWRCTYRVQARRVIGLLQHKMAVRREAKAKVRHGRLRFPRVIWMALAWDCNQLRARLCRSSSCPHDRLGLRSAQNCPPAPARPRPVWRVRGWPQRCWSSASARATHVQARRLAQGLRMKFLSPAAR